MRQVQKPRKGNALSYCITRSHGFRGFITTDYPLVSAHGFLPAVALPVFPFLLLPAATLPAAPVAPGLCSSLLLPAAPPCCAALLPAAPRCFLLLSGSPSCPPPVRRVAPGSPRVRVSACRRADSAGEQPGLPTRQRPTGRREHPLQIHSQSTQDPSPEHQAPRLEYPDPYPGHPDPLPERPDPFSEHQDP